jgi:hypothetical protein
LGKLRKKRRYLLNSKFGVDNINKNKVLAFSEIEGCEEKPSGESFLEGRVGFSNSPVLETLVPVVDSNSTDLVIPSSPSSNVLRKGNGEANSIEKLKLEKQQESSIPGMVSPGLVVSSILGVGKDAASFVNNDDLSKNSDFSIWSLILFVSLCLVLFCIVSYYGIEILWRLKLIPKENTIGLSAKDINFSRFFLPLGKRFYQSFSRLRCFSAWLIYQYWGYTSLRADPFDLFHNVRIPKLVPFAI